MPLHYSPLCDTDVRVYTLYLLANGCNVVSSDAVGGEAGVVECKHVGADDGRCNDCLSRGFDVEGATRLVHLCGLGFEAGLHGGDHSRVGNAFRGVVGIPSRGICGGGGVVGNSVVDDVEESGGRESVVSDAKVLGVKSPVRGGLARGKNFVGNSLKRERNKLKKKDLQEKRKKKSDAGSVDATLVDVVPEWRRKTDTRVGYFSALDTATQLELKNSRAKMLIAKNRRSEQLANKQVECDSGSEAAIKTVLRALNVADSLRKSVSDSKMSGWARTVADSYAKSVVDSVSSSHSSMVSLDSVQFGEQAVGLMTKEDRRSEYDSKVEIVRNRWASAESFFPEDMEAEFKALKAEYADVFFSSEEAAVRHGIAEFAGVLCGLGLNPTKIGEAMDMLDD